ncbi:MAG: single-stranded-DNA-specific exonuclease RecJ [Clostridia bacterium]|nr:single-stranded-DNA-specific exonuclease RecJ [Clostridia bacterium]
MEYKVRCGELTPEQLAAFNQTGYSEKFIRLLVERGVDTPQKAEKFFNFDPHQLHDPFLLKGMQAAVTRLRDAIDQKQHILIIGDYDADGICATAILYKYLLTQRVKTSYFLPERDADGYGLNIDLIKRLNEKFHPQLLVTVDCGISCAEEIKYAQSLGIDCIVTDHHAIPAVTPNCTCVDPKFKDQDYPFDDLCGAGVALKLVQAMESLEVAEKYFDICAIATVADIVSLTDENRVIVHHGLKMLNQGTVPGITALAKACNIRNEIKSGDISFRLGPKINASGRMGNAKRGLDVILEQDPERLDRIIKNLLFMNVKRQELCTSIFNESVALIESEGLQNDCAIVIAKPEWESGVLGIVAVRLTEKYGKPCLVLGGKGEVYKGSGRSIPGINLIECITKSAEYLSTFGGHSMAAGVSLPVENFDKFRRLFQSIVAESLATKPLENCKYYDFEISAEELNPKFFSEVATLEPTGCGNPSPVLMTVLHQTHASSLPAHPTHTKFDNGQLKFIFFGGAVFNEILAAPCVKSVIFELQQNNGVAPQAVVKCVIPFAINDDEKAMVLQRYLHDDLAVTPDVNLQTIINELSVDRAVFIDYYKATLNLVNQNNFCQSPLKLFAKIVLPEKNLFQFVFCFAVFEQLGIYEVVRNRLRIHNERTTELNKSAIYNKIVNLK